MPNLSSFLDFMRSLSFSGLVSAGLGGLIYFFLFPHALIGIVGAKTFIIFCGLLGAGLQQALRGLFNNFITPTGRYILYYEKLLEISILRNKGIITPEKYQQLVDRLTDERFVGTPLPSSSKQLPPQP